jgi:hypothetical protein
LALVHRERAAAIDNVASHLIAEAWSGTPAASSRDTQKTNSIPSGARFSLQPKASRAAERKAAGSAVLTLNGAVHPDRLKEHEKSPSQDDMIIIRDEAPALVRCPPVTYPRSTRGSPAALAVAVAESRHPKQQAFMHEQVQGLRAGLPGVPVLLGKPACLTYY